MGLMFCALDDTNDDHAWVRDVYCLRCRWLYVHFASLFYPLFESTWSLFLLLVDPCHFYVTLKACVESMSLLHDHTARNQAAVSVEGPLGYASREGRGLGMLWISPSSMLQVSTHCSAHYRSGLSMLCRRNNFSGAITRSVHISLFNTSTGSEV